MRFTSPTSINTLSARLIGLASVVCLAGSILLTGCGEVKTATDHLISGNESFQSGDYKAAEVEYRKALKQEPNSSTALNNLGVILNELGKYDEAIETLRKAINNDPKNWIAHDALAEALTKKGHYYDAIAEAHKSVELAPSELRGHRALAEALLLKAKQDNNHDELKAAADEYKYILSMDSDDPVSHQNLAQALLLQKDNSTALSEAKRAVELAPDSADAKKTLADAYHESGDNSAAVKQLDEVIAKSPADNEARSKQQEYGRLSGR